MPTKGQEGHDMGKPEGVPEHPVPKLDAEHPGYETQDVNVGGVIYFLGGLLASIFVFFFLCFWVGKVINTEYVKEDGAPDQWHQYGITRPKDRVDLADNPAMQQKEFNAIKDTFPTPRLDADDGNQATADLHAREDLLLNYYSSSNGTTRIPIDKAMELVAQRGLGVAPAATAQLATMAGDSVPEIHAPLTSGFARTGFELDSIESREQRNIYAQASKEHKE